MKNAVLIMAGGSGSRLWPLTRRNNPKQSHRTFSQKSTFDYILELASEIVPAELIFTTVGDSQLEYVRNSAVLNENIIHQHTNKNTAPAILQSITCIMEKFGDCVISMIPSDHVITGGDMLKEALRTSFDIAENTQDIIAIGTKPLFPSTGFGYIKFADNTGTIKKVLSFKEKPDQKTAVTYVDDGKHLWNTGIYICRAGRLLEEYEKHLPEMFKYRNDHRSLFNNAESMSFDKGIIEKTNRLQAVLSEHLWMDMGTYDFLDHYFKKDPDRNIIHGKGLLYESENTSIISDRQMVVGFGINDLLVVSTSDVVFVCEKKYIQRIGDLFDKLLTDNGEKYL